MLELTEVEEVSTGLGAYSTHAAATIAPVTRVNRRRCLGIGDSAELRMDSRALGS